MDSIFGDVNFALIEYTSPGSRGILYLVEVANDETEHMRKDFAAVRGGAHFIPVNYLGAGIWGGGRLIYRPGCRSAGRKQAVLTVPVRRFPPPWSVEDIGAAFAVTDPLTNK